MIVPRYYEDLDVLHENTMPNRAYYIPASARMDTLGEERLKSDRFQLLNGSWLFRRYDSIYDLQEPFYAVKPPAAPETGKPAEAAGTAEAAAAFGTGAAVSAAAFGTGAAGAAAETEHHFIHVPVPGTWQNYGCDAHQYTNFRYPFPADPPYVPQENPCGAYVRHFTYTPDDNAPEVYLNFEGVDSCFYVWLNGNYVGYSQIAHATAEFCVTQYLRAGDNKLAVLVLKWCDGSYLEDQDKFRTSGIFRDVYLLMRPKACLYDYFVHTEMEHTPNNDDPAEGSKQVGAAACETGTGRVALEMDFLNGCVPVKASLYDEENTPVAEMSIAAQKLHAAVDMAAVETTEVTSAKAEAQDAAAAAGEAARLLHCAPVMLEVENPVLWNSEEPYLYTLVLEMPGEVITEQVGFRKVEIRDAVVYLNGNPIKFRGVNRHESYPVTGPVVSQKQIETDLRMIRRHNFNAIRASHYPNVPYFYQLCDRYGFMVIDEADNESHGPWMLCYQNDCDAERAGRWNELISDNPAFIEATVDRTRSMVERNKNRPCILVWSMGNEGGYGITFERALAWTKERDPSRLTHYESAFYRGKGRDYDYSNIDLYSRMYPDFQDVIDYAEGHSEKDYLDKPADAAADTDAQKACEALEPGVDAEQKAGTCSAADSPAGREKEAGPEVNAAAAGKAPAPAQKRPRRPFLMCEYAHSMGNGPGDFEDYFELIDRYDTVCGGFVWEWCDHAVYKGTSGAGKPVYLYGGDHGEYPHDGNFCMDGLVYPDRRPHTGLLEFKNVHRPARVVSYDQESGMLVLKNEMNFVNLSGYLSIRYEVRADGVLTASGETPAQEIPPIAPRQTGSLRLVVPVPEKGRSFLKISYILEKEFASAGQAAREVILEKGFDLGFDEIPLENADGRHQEAARLCAPAGMSAKTDIAAEETCAETAAGAENTVQPAAAAGRTDGGEQAAAADRTNAGNQAAGNAAKTAGADAASAYAGEAAGTEIVEETAACGAGIEITESDRCLELAGTHFLYRFNKLTGLFAECIVDEQALLAQEMTLSLWRAPTDNDSAIRLEWDKAQYERAMPRAYETACVQTDDAVYICTKMAVTAVSVQKILDIDAVWTVDRQGGLALKMDVKKNEEFPELPRFGLKLLLPGEMNRVSYYGLGPMESYRDKCRAASHGLYENTVAGMHEDYLKPQENGSHADTSIVKIYSGAQPKAEPADAPAEADCAAGAGKNLSLTAAAVTPFSFNVSPYTEQELTKKKHSFELEPCGHTVLHLDYAQNGIGSNSCGPRPKEEYRFDEQEFTFSIKLIPGAI